MIQRTAKVMATAGMAITLMPVPAATQPGRWASVEDPVAEEMTAWEKMWAESACSPQPGLRDTIADDFQGTASNGNR